MNGRGEDAVGRVAGEIESLRGDLGGLVAELDRRRHEAFDLRLQLRRHPAAAAIAAAAAALVIGGLLAVAARRRHQRKRPSVRAREARRAMSRLLDHPDRVAAEPSMTNRVAVAVLAAAGTAIVRRMLEQPARAR